MRQPWFRKRAPDEGVGYTVASREGVIASAVFAVVATGTMLVPIIMLGETAIAVTIGAILQTPLVLGFTAFVRRRSDDRNR